MLVKNQQDFWSGLMFMALGAGFALIAQAKYSMGTAARMGPGYFPFILGVLLVILGAIVALSALRGEHNHEHDVRHFDWDILILVIGSISLFALMLNYVGIYLSIVILILFSSLASHEFSFKIAVFNAIFLILFAWLTFIKGLGLVFPTLPIPFAEWSSIAQVVIPLSIVAGLVVLVFKIKGSK
ncbi:tripartite tricarboxylate transporter TctB family protein [Pelistega europaea]|uniref:Tripartite tricarboxylate transporter TctB family protein n=1 Tax=Pelistega europaea TaxID=106147 RepID=A0A7Y4LD87_9BURK|nr:tripartite tricarboxylate transporter TctB family protein [Pelistega europaea]NOL50096.1 tripartite tricarboxylate transporter TctB family protein [Pelistega europaea]